VNPRINTLLPQLAFAFVGACVRLGYYRQDLLAATSLLRCLKKS
jgi:hypothetical protein